MRKKSIPKDVKKEVTQIIERFNDEVLGDFESFYIRRWRGNSLYLDRNDYGTICHICRLEYTGKMTKWEFAIFKYSSEAYDPEEWFFPGRDYVDGTIEGALKAGIEAYPIA